MQAADLSSVREPTVRLFTALWPGPATREALALWQQGWIWPAGAARVPPARLHVTLHFLGNVAAQSVPPLIEALRLPFRPFELDFGHGEVWPDGIAVLRPRATPRPLAALHEAMADALAACGMPMQPRAYLPHVTLARHAQGATPPAEGPFLRWRVEDGYVLVRSLPQGAGYEALHRWA